MYVGVLGPLEVRSGGELVRLPGPMPRCVLAMLASRVGQEYDADELVHGLWGAGAPAAGRRILHSHISRLRSSLPSHAIVGADSRYRLDLPAEQVDATAFEAEVARGRVQLDGDDPAAAVTLRSALARWRGRAYAEFGGCEPLEAERVRLDQLRLDALEWRIAADLAGGGAPPVAELEHLVGAFPTREALWALLMRALYRSGRQADALATYQRARRLLSDELGLEPGSELRRTQELVLNQDPVLEPRRTSETATVADELRTVSIVAVELPEEQSGARDLATRLAHFRALVAERAARFGGTPIEHTGTRTVVAFGTPIAHEDDAQRAVAAAEALAADEPVRVAVATGQVVAHPSGELTGRTVGSVLDLLATASPGVVALDDATRAATTDQLTAPPARFVGRADDLGILQTAFDRSAVAASPQFVTVIGEAGIGKTRLVEEFVAAVERQRPDVGVLRTGCAAYGDAAALSPLARLVEAGVGIEPGDDRDQAMAKLMALLPEDEGPDLVPWLEPLLGLSSQVLQNRPAAFAAWRRFLTIVARTPTILVVEDVHWAEDLLLDLFAGLAEQDARVLVVSTARPEILDTRPDWVALGLAWRLGPLADDATRELLEGLLGADRVSDRLVERTGGVPLFARELARLPGGEDEAPRSLSTLLSARLDTLDPSARALLCVASCAGRSYYADQVAALVEQPVEQVAATCEVLARRQFVRRVARPRRGGSAEYRFAHDLVLDAAQSRLTVADRARHHLALARWWQAQTGDREMEYADAVARHALAAYDLAGEAGEDGLAGATRPLAADAAGTAGARLQGLDTEAALRLLQRAVDLAEPGSWRQGQALTFLGASLHDARQYERAHDELQRALAILDPLNDPLRADALLFLTTVVFQLGWDPTPALAAAERAVEELPDSRARVRMLAVVGMSEVIVQTRESARRAIELADRALAIDAELQCGGTAMAHVVRGRARLLLGDDGLSELEEGIPELMLTDTGTLYLGSHQWLAGAMHHWRGPAAEWAVRQRIREISAERGLDFAISTGASEEVRTLYEMGRYADAVALADEVGAGEAMLRWTVVQGALARWELGELTSADVARVAATPPADANDPRHLIGQAIVSSLWAQHAGDAAAAEEAIAALDPFTQFVDRDGAFELLPALVRLAVRLGRADLAAGVSSLDSGETPLRAAVDATLRGLAAGPDRARALLGEALRRWEALGFVTEADAVRRDLETS